MGGFSGQTVKRTVEFFTVCTKLAEMEILYSKDLTTAKKSYPVGLNLVQEIIAGLGVHVLFRGSLNFCLYTT